jgi:hypothetical protein
MGPKKVAEKVSLFRIFGLDNKISRNVTGEEYASERSFMFINIVCMRASPWHDYSWVKP